MSDFKTSIGPVKQQRLQPQAEFVMTERQKLIRVIGNRLFAALLVFLAVLTFWAGFVSLTGDRFIGTLPVVIFTGVLGGMIGIQNRLRTLSNSDLLQLSHSMSDLLLAPLVGGFLAIVLYIMFVSGLLDGALFPTFEADKIRTTYYGVFGGSSVNESVDKLASMEPGISSLFSIHGVSYEDYGKLIFWCFLAGFSERFVTNLVSNFEDSGTAQVHADAQLSKPAPSVAPPAATGIRDLDVAEIVEIVDSEGADSDDEGSAITPGLKVGEEEGNAHERLTPV